MSGSQAVSFVEWLPLFQSVHYQRFHCTVKQSDILWAAKLCPITEVVGLWSDS